MSEVINQVECPERNDRPMIGVLICVNVIVKDTTGFLALKVGKVEAMPRHGEGLDLFPFPVRVVIKGITWHPFGLHQTSVSLHADHEAQPLRNEHEPPQKTMDRFCQIFKEHGFTIKY